MLQALAYHAVGVEQVGCGDTFAVRRVGDDDGLVLGLHEVLKVLLLDGDAAGESGCLDVGASRVHGLEVDVVAVDMVLELTLLRVVVIDTVEELLVEVGPFLEGILLAEESRGHVACDESCLDGEGAAAAHRVDEIGIALPSGHHDDAGCEHLVDGSFDALLAVSSAVEALAAGVKAEGAVVLGDVDVESQVRIADRYVGPLACALA